jgi:GTP1/Obg family GTP-binding protein
VPLSRYLKSFPPLSALHPFEAALLDLTVGSATYASVLGKADALRKAIQEVNEHRVASTSCRGSVLCCMLPVAVAKSNAAG